MAKITIKTTDIIGDVIRWDQAKKKAAQIDTNEINKKVAEVFPVEKLADIKKNATCEIDNIFKDIFNM